MIYFEDIELGHKDHLPGPTVTKEDIFAFAREWDPQPHHLDEDVAEKSILGGLSASGWHNSVLLMKMVFGNREREPVAFLGSPGVEEVRWRTPLRPGDRLHAIGEVVAKRESQSRPYMGLVTRQYEMFNHQDTHILSMTVVGMIAKRPDDEGAP